MPTFENAVADADEAQTALRALAHATRAIDDPRQIYSVLGSLTSAVASLSQSLHQLATVHDGPVPKPAWVPASTAKSRSAAYRASWELHRAAEMLRQVDETIANAHEAEASITYTRAPLETAVSRSVAFERGLEL